MLVTSGAMLTAIVGTGVTVITMAFEFAVAGLAHVALLVIVT